MTNKNENIKTLTSDKPIGFGVYCELAVGNKWCFKYQFPGQDIVIVSDPDKEKAASRFFIEYLKSLHYSLRYSYEGDRFDELRMTIDKYRALNDPNIDKTIDIVTRTMKF